METTISKKATVIGAGLAGSEAAWQVAQAGFQVDVFEMRPTTTTKAHKTNLCAELVCSNSFRGTDLSNAVGLLKEELKICKSLIMEAALFAQVPAGGALAVDRMVFSEYVDQKIRSHPLIKFKEIETINIPESSLNNPVILATGPLTSPSLAQEIEKLTGHGRLAFFDAISPIIQSDSIDFSQCFQQSRYDKGGNDYWNLPLEKDAYYAFIESVKAAEKYLGNQEVENDSLEKLKPFEGCMPIEDMIERGDDTLLFGPFKPVGLTDPKNNRRPYAVIQLRQDDKAATLWSMVGMQTRMKRHEQEKIFRSLPGLQTAEFVRFGSVHRNTFIDSPKCLFPTLQFRDRPSLFFAGQITGVEGYVESTSGGLVAGINVAQLLKGNELLNFPASTATGALLHYISDPDRKDFQPMNVSYGLIDSYENEPKRTDAGKKIPKKDRRISTAQKALEQITKLIDSIS
jgi:methylenetetrahydrofolate--tRNA-(uracil-5-)-methyltransferase